MTIEEADQIFDEKGADVFEVFDELISVKQDYDKATNYYMLVTGCDKSIAREAVLKYVNDLEHVKSRIPQLNIPQCPICQSTDLSKISTTKKVAKIATFGLYGAGDIGKTWKCNNCGSKF